MFVPQSRKWGNVYLLVYVDDLVVAAKKGPQIKCVYSMLSRKFEVKVLGAISHYLSMVIIRTDAFNYKKRQKQYIKNVLIKFGLQDAKNSKYP